VKVAEEDDRSAAQAWRGGHAQMLTDFTRSIAVVETVRRVEEDVAETLRTLAAQAKGTVAARRLRLAEDAARGARAAAEHGERLRQQARRWAGHTGVVALRPALDHVGPQPGQAPAAARTAGRNVPLKSALHQRLADIDRRLAALQLAGPKPTGDDPMRDAQRSAREAQRHCHDAVAHLLQARQLAAEVLDRSASAHDRAAEANARSAGAGIGDVAEHNRMAAFHRAAARADRERAQEGRILAAQSLEATRWPGSAGRYERPIIGPVRRGQAAGRASGTAATPPLPHAAGQAGHPGQG